MSESSAASSLPLGSTWEIKSKGRVTVTRPDGSTVKVVSSGGIAGHVLNVPGTYTADIGNKTPISIKAG